jgi:hypothetical protein
MSGHTRHRPRKKSRNSIKNIVFSWYTLAFAVVATLALCYFIFFIPYAYFPQSIIVQGNTSDGETSEYAVKDGDSILFYADLGGVKGIYRLDTKNNVVSRFCKGIWGIDRKRNAMRIAELPPISLIYTSNLFSRNGNKVILLNQSYKSDGYHQNQQSAHAFDSAIYFDIRTHKSATLFKTAEKQRILYCDRDRAMVYSNGAIYRVTLENGKWTKIYSLPTCHKLVTQSCGNYLFLYSCVGSFSNQQNYDVQLLKYIEVS